VPHAWVARDRTRVSTLDLGGHGRFTVLTGVGGDGWVAAAAAVGAELGVPVAAVTIGPGADYEDLYGDWARLREVDDGGCLLLRPDNHVCFRARTAPTDPSTTLRDALRRVLSLPVT
jgi:2,4-dichlorophenol 6-monooxygenase